MRRNSPSIMGTVVDCNMGVFYTREELVRARQQWKHAGKTVVFTNGCYDILHPGHIRLLEQARSLGRHSYSRIEHGLQRAAAERAVASADSRSASAPSSPARSMRWMPLRCSTKTRPRELIAEVLPDILIKGADWSHFIAGREEVEAAGGRVMALPLEPGYSTTNMVEEILRRGA